MEQDPKEPKIVGNWNLSKKTARRITLALFWITFAYALYVTITVVMLR